MGLCRMAGDPLRIVNRLEKFMRDDAYSAALFENTYGFSSQTTLVEGIQCEIQSLRS
jgi:hypothetical protein